jgi:hypothetical protein
MRKSIFLLFLLVVTVYIVSCDSLTDTADNTVSLHYLTTELGGCNNRDFNLKNIFQEAGNDTLYWMISGDTLKFFIGINYICCAPFTTDYNISKDTVTMQLKDTCSSPNSCYCKCMCYYTFLFQFKQYDSQNLYYNVVLINPAKGDTRQIFFGEVKK